MKEEKRLDDNDLLTPELIAGLREAFEADVAERGLRAKWIPAEMPPYGGRYNGDLEYVFYGWVSHTLMEMRKAKEVTTIHLSTAMAELLVEGREGDSLEDKLRQVSDELNGPEVTYFPRKAWGEKKELASKLRASNRSIRDIAAEVGVFPETVARWFGVDMARVNRSEKQLDIFSGDQPPVEQVIKDIIGSSEVFAPPQEEVEAAPAFDFSPERFQDEAAAREYMEGMRWPNRVKCPYCNIAGNVNQRERRQNFWCANCGHSFSVLAWTALHGSKLPLTHWIRCVHVLANVEHAEHQLVASIVETTTDTTRVIMALVRKALSEIPGMPEILYPELEMAHNKRVQKRREIRERNVLQRLLNMQPQVRVEEE